MEYGNPSGHSVTSMSFYLTIWDMFCRHYEASVYARRTSLAFTLVFIFCVAFSRIYHGVHTYNQILQGWVLGAALFFLYSRILYRDITGFVTRVHCKSFRELLVNKGTCVYVALVCLANFNLLFGESIHPVPIEWHNTIRQNCPEIAGV